MALGFDDVDLGRDRRLVERYQRGDQRAFEELYHRYYERLVRFCQRRVTSRDEAEELAQETFVRALESLTDFGGERRFYPWVTVIASRLAVDAHRRTARCEPMPDIDPGAAESSAEEVMRLLDAAVLQQATERLRPRHQEVLDLREQQGWSYKRIAAHLDVSPGAVEALLVRARKALKRQVILLCGDRRLAGLPVLGASIRRLRSLLGRLDPATAQPIAQWASTAAGLAVVIATTAGVALSSDPRGHSVSLRDGGPPATEIGDDGASEGVGGSGTVDSVFIREPAPSEGLDREERRPAQAVRVTDAEEAYDNAGPVGVASDEVVIGADPTAITEDVLGRLDDYGSALEDDLP